MFANFFPGDHVKYVGNKFLTELGTKRGEVVSCVSNQPFAVVVDFGDDTYICKSTSLVKYVPTPAEEREYVSRRKFALDEE
jgi:hypothetical protein